MYVTHIKIIKKKTERFNYLVSKPVAVVEEQQHTHLERGHLYDVSAGLRGR